MDISTIQSTISTIESDATAILDVIKGIDPVLEVPVDVAENIVDIVAGLVGKALAAWSAASGTPITQASVLTLLPDNTPLDVPTS